MAGTSSSKKVRASRAKVRRREVKASSLRRWVRRARGKGMRVREIVADLHVRRGMELREVAVVLRLGVGVVREHWRQSCEARARAALVRAEARRSKKVASRMVAPKSKGDFAAMREQLSLALWETVVVTFGDPGPGGGAEAGGAAAEGMAGGEKGKGDGGEAVPPSVSSSRSRARRTPLLAVRIRALKQLAKLYGLKGGRKRRRKLTGG